MKNTFKKIAASMMAVASLAVSVAGMSANAYWGSRSFDDGISTATAYLSVSSTSVYGYTSASHYKSKTVDLHNYGSGSGNNHGEGTARKVEAQVFGSGYTFSNSVHTSNGVPLNPDMAVWL